jgi:hypothetical protein
VHGVRGLPVYGGDGREVPSLAVTLLAVYSSSVCVCMVSVFVLCASFYALDINISLIHPHLPTVPTVNITSALTSTPSSSS